MNVGICEESWHSILVVEHCSLNNVRVRLAVKCILTTRLWKTTQNFIKYRVTQGKAEVAEEFLSWFSRHCCSWCQLQLHVFRGFKNCALE